MLKKKPPEEKNLLIIRDRENVITNAINTTIPNIKPLHCWNHIKRHIRMHLTTLGATSNEKSFYVNQYLI